MTYVIAIAGYIAAALCIVGVAALILFAAVCASLLGRSVPDDDAPVIDPFTHGSGTP